MHTRMHVLPAGMIYRPNRERDVEYLKKCANEMFKATGHEEISLSH